MYLGRGRVSPSRAVSGTDFPVYRLVQWLSRTGRSEPEKRGTV